MPYQASKVKQIKRYLNGLSNFNIPKVLLFNYSVLFEFQYYLIKMMLIDNLNQIKFLNIKPSRDLEQHLEEKLL